MESARLIILGFLCATLGSYYRSSEELIVYSADDELSDEEYKEFIADRGRIPVLYRYPSLPLFSPSGTAEFGTVRKILGSDNAKCRFGKRMTVININTRPDMLQPHLSYFKDENEKFYEGPINVAHMLGWIVRQKICDITCNDFERVKAYRDSLERGHIQVYVLTPREKYDEETFDSVYDDFLKTEVNVPMIHVTDMRSIRFILYEAGLQTSSLSSPAILVLRNIAHMQKTTVYWKNLTNKKKVQEFFKRELIPLVHGTDSFMLSDIFSMGKTIVYMYTRDEHLSKYIDLSWLEDFARKNMEKFVFLHSKGVQVIENKLNQLLVIDSEYIETAVRAFEIRFDMSEFIKYKPLTLQDGKITKTGLSEFIKDLEDKKLGHFIKSEPAIPESIDKGPVKTIVGEDFHRRVIESENDILMLFHSPWCGQCQHSKRVFRDLGRRLRDVRTITVAKFDAFNNEVEGLYIVQYPVIFLYPHGSKDKPAVFIGEITLQNLAKFVQIESKRTQITAEEIMERDLHIEPIFEMHTEL